MKTTWRLIEEGPASGGWNMGVDEALLATAVGGLASFRLYSWDGPWLSLGYGQRPGAAIREACREAGVGVVRRVTGGRAVLHGGDLTYAIAAPETALPLGLRGSYEKLAEVLQGALATIGVAADRSAAGAGGSRDPTGRARRAGQGAFDGFDCFEAAAADEICLSGAKLAGSAQRRAGGAVLQHGSIRLRPDSAALARAVGLGGPGATSLLESGHEVGEDALRHALVESFDAVFETSLVSDGLSPDEESMAGARVRQHQRDPLAKPQLPL